MINLSSVETHINLGHFYSNWCWSMHKRMVAISFKIPEELYEELKIAASERNTSKSAILRALVESFVNQRKLKYRRYIGRGIVIW